MSKTDRHQLPPTPVRIPPDLKTLLQAEAAANDRSLNGEILARLRSTLKGRIKKPTSKENQ
ncbi:hypothetical protein KDK82_2324 [Delftia sp. K82]|uniref:Arc family DNA-binding protein n=1 Tax=Delftia sp. K82 TaxID=1472718 RepID=UPI000B48E23C|nr:Arc family DNA-binding protein [Delftia sp. K82]OWG18844.1 hypothetical protein KDK82_2324 [Delftia sp. K82]